MLRTIKIKSDFYDYYDYLSDDNSKVVYTRVYNEGMNIGTSLKLLRRKGIRTIQIGSVREMASKSNKIRVYLDYGGTPDEYSVVMDSNEAIIMYPNYPASKFYAEFTGVMYKFLQIGRSRVGMILSNDEVGNVIVSNLQELVGGYSKIYGNPIFSIDYINTNEGMLAARLNSVEKLETLGIQNIIEPVEVVREIYAVICPSNKIGGG